MDRFIEFALVAAREALTQAGWSPASAAEQDRTATVIATGIGGFSEIAHAVHTNGPIAGRVACLRSPSSFLPTWPPGMCLSPTVSVAPSVRWSPPRGSAQAIGDAARMIRAGEADIASAAAQKRQPSR